MKIENYLFSAKTSGLKKNGQLDLALVFSNIPLRVSAVFTKNKIKAAPVILSKKNSKNIIRALIVNSGNANACNGTDGIKDAKKVMSLAAEALNIKENNILICSTGVIGERLDTSKIENSLPELVKSLSEDGAEQVARAIMTTDTFPKVVVKNMTINNKNYHIVGMAKGSGMIMPNMATMLAFIMTDLPLSKNLGDALFKECVKYSFNSITVDGDTSTNDTAFFLYPDADMYFANNDGPAYGSSAFKGILEKDINYDIVKYSVGEVCLSLAKMIAEDGEGATKSVTVEAINAYSESSAKKIAFSVANSPLVKTAIAGEDLNWGRIMMAIGKAGARIKPNYVDIYINNFKIVENSKSLGFIGAENEKKIMSQKEINIKIDLKCGPSFFKVLTCDFTNEYININASYRS
ncbi:MAG: bifunctional glutamate N-acetyltransferase/amino-acid acetyltransferase ArgJ [Candidatus Acididesulfobacter guangdongensis]|uniref:Arginine biosynthesis bifunctional protein ArgJ n=1 Tax=Acididesulfobacter guangdongensis TaxID=2597225 RepID=A0A519BF39_ACIG2|nr:MAG: bifunctional glutamate N-acetyltransferase/amino-acid acetyltransferase ArgJ [Candidatus Acididesulfobacter guangdongensis]